MHSEIRELLFHPDSFFDRIILEKPGLAIPSAIVGIGSIVGLLTPFIISAFPSGRAPAKVLLMADAFLPLLILPFIAWILITGILYVISRLFHGTGTFTTTLQNVGYGSLPLTLLSLFGIINGIVSAQYTAIPSMIRTGAIIGLGGISVFFVIWSGWLWTVAMEKTHILSRGKATVAAVIVVLLYMSPVILNIIALLYFTGSLRG